MIKNFKINKGFTILEILVTLSIIGIISSVVIYSFSKYADDRALDSAVSIALSALSQARSQTVSAKVGAPFGVHFESKTITLYSSTYIANNSKNVVYPIAGNVTISNISLLGTGNNVLFRKLVGSTNNYGTVTISQTTGTNKTKVVSISNVGLVSSN